MSFREVYLIHGRGEKLGDELGDAIAAIGYSIQGREIIADFERLWFSEQMEILRSDIEKGFWSPDGILVGRSYGAYLLLHALAEMRPYPGKILLFSPVLGAATAIKKNHLYGSIPPQGERLYQLAKNNRFPAPGYMEIHTGAEDRGCDPALAEEFASSVTNTRLHILPGMGHNLEQHYINEVLEMFLGTEV